MRSVSARKILLGLCVIMTVFALVAVAQTTTKERTVTGKQVAAQTLKGTVVFNQGGTVVVKMSSGELRTLTPPAGTTVKVDGVDTPASDVKVGTQLTATITTTTTSVTDRTVTVGSGKVWYVAGNNVILTMPDGTNKQFKVQPHFKFKVDGKDADVSALKKGMVVSAEKIVEEPLTMVDTSKAVVGHLPPPPPPKEVAKAEPAPAPAPAPVAEAPAKKLPKTGSPFALIGMLGVLFTGAGFALRKLR